MVFALHKRCDALGFGGRAKLHDRPKVSSQSGHRIIFFYYYLHLTSSNTFLLITRTKISTISEHSIARQSVSLECSVSLFC